MPLRGYVDSRVPPPVVPLAKDVVDFWSRSDDELASQFLSLQTRADVAALLGVRLRTLTGILWGRSGGDRYRQFEIPKKAGGTRLISAPNGQMLEYQRRFKCVLETVYRRRTPVKGFVKGESIATNASWHVGRRWVFNTDLESFFPTIHFGRVRGLLMADPYFVGPDAATTLAQLACFRGSLPIGGAVSPLLSNMLCVGLDGALLRLARDCGAYYTRYADDLTFSTHRPELDARLAVLDKNGRWTTGVQLKSEIEQHGFLVNEAKSRAMSRRDRQEVTGLVVNERLNVDRRFVRNVRAAIHELECSIESEDPAEASERVSRSIEGRIAFMKMVRGANDPIARRFEAQHANLVQGRPRLHGSDVRASAPGERVMRILHLSDLHFSVSRTWDSDPVLSSLISCLEREDDAIDLVVVTGDIAWSGKPAEYGIAGQWFVQRLLPALGLSSNRLLIVPGNHDVDRDRVSAIVSSLRTALRSADPDVRDAVAFEVISDPSQLSVLEAPFEAYEAFMKDVLGSAELFWSRRLDVNRVDLVVAGLCSAVVSESGDIQGNQMVTLPQVRMATANTGEVNLSLVHHPPIWFDETDREATRVLEQWSDVILHGHEHLEQAYSVTGDRAFLRFAASSAYQGSRMWNGFSILEIDAGPRTLRLFPYRRHAESGEWQRSLDVHPLADEGAPTFPLPDSTQLGGRAVV